jgi:hypothetical protein
MSQTINIKDLRKQLKPLGYKVATKSLYIGIQATIIRISDSQVLPSIFCGKEDLESWKPVLDVIKDIKVVNDYSDKIYGPW